MKIKTKEKGKKSITIWFIIKKLIYFGIFIPLVIITSNIGYQLLVYPDKVPNIFGYKFFMMLNEQGDGYTEYGDLVFTKIIDIEEYEIGDKTEYKKLVRSIPDSTTFDVAIVLVPTEEDESNLNKMNGKTQ